MVDGVYSIDDETIDIEVKENLDSKYIKICYVCGKLFLAKGRNASRSKVCPREHYRKCCVCGEVFPLTKKEFDRGLDESLKKCCSRKCSNKARGEGLKNSMKEIYGVENPSQVKEFQDKAQEKRDLKLKETAKKREQTMMDRYGAAYPMQIEEFKEKARQTNQKRYHTDNPSLNDQIKQKISKKLKSKEVRDKAIQTSLKHYGTEYPSQSEQVLNQMKSTCREKYGYDWAIQNQEIKNKMKENRQKYMMKTYGVPYIFQVPEFKEKAKSTNLEKYDVLWYILSDEYRKGNTGLSISEENKRFAQRLNDMGLKTEFEFSVDSNRYDIHIVDTNILIEINPSYTHNYLGLNHWGTKKEIKYHYKKSEIAKANGYRCIHIWDWDDKSKILDMLNPNKKTLYARNCDLVVIDQKTSKMFCDLYHLQGGLSRNQSYCVGLYANIDNSYELVEIMTFGKARYSKKYEWELMRLCSNSLYKVVGGAEKLFKKFKEDNNPESILSYCDISKFDGSVYERLGMKLDRISDPNIIWWNDSSTISSKYIKNNYLLKLGFDQIFGTNYGKGTSNKQLMIDHGWLPVYDCGQYVFTWSK